MLEIEKKYRISQDQFEAIEASLMEFQAAFIGEDFEVNTIYTGPSLVALDAVLRIRDAGDRTILTFKKRVDHASDIKHQIEHETEVADGDELRKIVANLDLVPQLLYEKRRKKWNFRSVEIVLDQLPFGLFMEIEGRITAIREAEMVLDLHNLETEHRTYPALTLLHGIERGGVFEARFTD